MTVRVSVVICTHNRYATLGEAIASVEMQDCAHDRFELLVVDNSSDKAGQEAFREDLDINCPHRYIVEDVPGLSRARNIGVHAAAGDIVAFMDDDARAAGHWVAEMIDTFDAHPKAGIVGGPVRPIWPDARPAWLHPWLEGFLTIVDRGPSLRRLAKGEWLAGTNIAFRRPPLIESGLFNEKLGRIGKLLLSNEELSVSTAMEAMGYEILYDPRLEMHHRVHADRINQAWMRRRVFWQVMSDLFAQDGEVGGDLQTDVGRVLDYLQLLPPKERAIAGLFRDVDDPEMFHKQTEALSCLVRLLATDGEDWRGFLHAPAA